MSAIVTSLPTRKFDVVIVGAGGSGMRASLPALAAHLPRQGNDLGLKEFFDEFIERWEAYARARDARGGQEDGAKARAFRRSKKEVRCDFGGRLPRDCMARAISWTRVAEAGRPSKRISPTIPHIAYCHPLFCWLPRADGSSKAKANRCLVARA